MTLNKEDLKNKIIYRASYRGTKEMDILLSSFVKLYIDKFTNTQLKELEKFLHYEDEIILNFYNLLLSGITIILLSSLCRCLSDSFLKSCAYQHTSAPA